MVAGDHGFDVTPTGAWVGSKLEGRHRPHFRMTWWSTLWAAVSRPTSVWPGRSPSCGQATVR